MDDFKIMAPDFKGIREWINSKPLTMKKLEGKVVLVDFWTYTCINCSRTLPYLKEWHRKYSKKGLVIVGVHSPEFEFEKNPKNVKKAVKRSGIKYPVAIDSNMETWKNFDNQYWPAKFIIDREGYVRYVHFGEGNYEQIELAIQELLGISGKTEKEKPTSFMPDQSPETYCGYSKSPGFGSGLVCDKKGCNYYVDSDEHELNKVYPDGRWVQERDYLELAKAPGKLSYRFYAREVNIVAAPVDKTVKADVFIDKKKKKSITIRSADTYNVFKSKKYAERDLGVVFHGKVRVFVYTFG